MCSGVYGCISRLNGLRAVLLRGLLCSKTDTHLSVCSNAHFKAPFTLIETEKGSRKAFQMSLAKALTPCEMHLFHIALKRRPSHLKNNHLRCRFATPGYLFKDTYWMFQFHITYHIILPLWLQLQTQPRINTQQLLIVPQRPILKIASVHQLWWSCTVTALYPLVQSQVT